MIGGEILWYTGPITQGDFSRAHCLYIVGGEIVLPGMRRR